MILLALAVLCILLLLVIGLGFLFGIIHIDVDIQYINQHFEVRLSILLWKLRLIRFNIPELKINDFPDDISVKHRSNLMGKKKTEGTRLNEHRLKSLWKKGEKLRQVFKDMDSDTSFIKSMKMTHIKWYTAVGFDKADVTGWLTGVVWTVKSFVIKLLGEHLTVSGQPLYDVHPAYNTLTLQSHFKCRVSFRLRTFLKAFFWSYKQMRGRKETACQNIQSKA